MKRYSMCLGSDGLENPEGQWVRYEDVEQLINHVAVVTDPKFPQEAYDSNKGAVHLTLDGYEIRPGMLLYTKGPSTARVESVGYMHVYGIINGMGSAGPMDISGSYAKDPN